MCILLNLEYANFLVSNLFFQKLQKKNLHGVGREGGLIPYNFRRQVEASSKNIFIVLHSIRDLILVANYDDGSRPRNPSVIISSNAIAVKELS